jgi:hypothetical protein
LAYSASKDPPVREANLSGSFEGGNMRRAADGILVDVKDPLPTETIGALERMGHYAADIAKSACRLVVRPTLRTGDVVSAEYDGGHWKRVLTSREWERHADLASFLIGSNTSQRLCVINQQIVRVPTSVYYQYRLRALPELISSLAGGVRGIVELGAGVGHNIFTLLLSDQFDSARGFDISENGIRAGNLVARHFGLTERACFDRLDLTQPDDPNLVRIRNQTVFTYFCIEQIPYSVEKLVSNLISARPRRVIHVEPTTELLDLTRVRDFVSYLYIKSVDYQTRLFTHLEELARRGDIRILRRMRMPFAPTIHNDGFVISWEPT